MKDVVTASNQISHWTFSGINVNILHCELLSVHLNFLSPNKNFKVANTLLSVHNSSFGMLHLNTGTEAMISEVHMDAEHILSHSTLILANRSTIVMRNCTFDNFFNENSPTILTGHSNTIVTIDNVRFFKHHAMKGVVHLHSDCVLTMSNSVVQHNHAYSYGFSVFTFQQQTQATFKDVNFVNNSALKGGALSAEHQCHVTCNYCTFTANKAINGGAIWTSRETSLVLVNSLFGENSALENQTLLDTVIPGSEHLMSYVQSSSMQLNYELSGGSIYVFQGNVQSSKNQFVNNKANYGGAMSLINGTVQIQGCLFTYNRAIFQGGAINALNGTQLEVKQSVFKRNYAAINAVTDFKFDKSEAQKVSDGGGIHLFNQVQTTIIDSILLDNFATRHGGALQGSIDVSVSIYKCNFTGNKALADGGAINIQTKALLTSTNCVFDGNRALYSGGAIMALIDVKIEIHSATFRKNNVSYDGGVISVQKQSLSLLTNSFFGKNFAGANGGSIVGIINVTLEAHFSVFIGNVASTTGGAIFLARNARLYMNNDYFQSNDADQYGGAVSGLKNVVLQINATKFTLNQVLNKGGAIYLEDQ